MEANRDVTSGANEGEGSPDPPPANARSFRPSLSTARSSATKEKKKAIRIFWECTNKSLEGWSAKLDVLKNEWREMNSGPSPNSGTNIRQRLSNLQEDLNILRRHCLSLSSLPFLTSSVDGIVYDFAVPELPSVDLRMLHVAFAEHGDRLRALREEITPKGRFTFRRYRAAMAVKGTTSIQPNAAKPKETSNKPKQVMKKDNCLHHVENATIVFDEESNLTATYNDSGDNVTVETLSSSSLMALEDMKHCTITINLPIPALHIQNVSNSTICVGRVTGPIHVTSCRNVTLRAPCQQLRLHESTQLHCHEASVAILEDCKDVTFHGQVIVNDFCWLRVGVPSPNYRILEEEKPPPDTDTAENDPPTEFEMTADVPSVVTTMETNAEVVQSEQTHSATVSDNSDDSDDEL